MCKTPTSLASTGAAAETKGLGLTHGTAEQRLLFDCLAVLDADLQPILSI